MLRRLVATPFASVIVWLFLKTAFSLTKGDRTLITLITESSVSPDLKLPIAVFTLIVIIGVVGLFITFAVIRPMIFLLVGATSVWICSLVIAGYEASGQPIATWEVVYFWFALQITAGGLLLSDTSQTETAKAAGG